MANTYIDTLTAGLWKRIPPFRLVLGLCPSLAVTMSAENGLGMGVATAFVLILSNGAISSLRNVIPSKVRIAAYIVIIATLVSIVEILMKAFFFQLSQQLGIYIPLIVVNCIILGRAEGYASKNPVPAAVGDGIGMGIGFALTLSALGGLREVFGAGALWDIPLIEWSRWVMFGDMLDFVGQGVSWEHSLFFVLPPGGFLILGLMMAASKLLPSMEAEG